MSTENEIAHGAKEETEASLCEPPKDDDDDDDGSISDRECDSPSGEIFSDSEIPAKVKSPKEDCSLLRSVDGELDYEEECAASAEDGIIPGAQESEEAELQVNTPDKEKDADKEAEDEGEIVDGDDLEEGELPQNADPSSPKPSEATRQVCRFFSRGQCFFGNACRFLHLTSNFPSHNDKGQYHMFGTTSRYSGYAYPGNLMGPSNSMMPDRSYAAPIDYVGTAPPPREPSQVESAWERGLREAKELVKRANKRKEEEPDFDKKKLNLSIHINEKNSPEYDKENDFYSRSYSKRDIHYKKATLYDEYDDHPAREQQYENFEIRYTRDDMPRDRKLRDRSRGREGLSSERERYTPKEGRNKERYNDDRERGFDIQMRTRAFEYVDPWRRSKTPKARQIHSRSGSYSSVSSYSCSDRSSRSYSYSRSSSRSSSCGSSRSASVTHKRKPSPGPSGSADVRQSPKGRGTNRFQMKKKAPPKPFGNRSPSSSRSRSVSRTPSISRSRSYSRSISMDSVSSASSSLSHSSSASESRKNRNASLTSLRKTDEKLPLEKLDSRNLSSYDRAEPERELKGSSIRSDMYQTELVDPPSIFPSFQHLLPGNEPKVKSQHKQQIKLTLLNKPTTSKVMSFPKKELDRSKILPDQKADSVKADVVTTAKRPLSPTSPTSGPKVNAPTQKKSASSRRDELLKQLKAVEDAIARKRAKFC